MTIFAKIIAGELPSNKIYEDDYILAFHDINPEAKIHALVVPKPTHLERIQDVTIDDAALIGYLMGKIPHIATLLGINETGYRVITNNGGEHVTQEVPHLHFHILGGELLGDKLAPVN